MSFVARRRDRPGEAAPVDVTLFGALASPPTGEKILKLAFTWNPDGTVATIKFYNENNKLLFTLNFSWNPDGTLREVSRT